MTDLRQSLIEAIQPYEGDGMWHESLTDDVLGVFADWLRERADRADEAVAIAREKIANHHVGMQIRLGGAAMQGAAGALRTAADVITAS